MVYYSVRDTVYNPVTFVALRRFLVNTSSDNIYRKRKTANQAVPERAVYSGTNVAAKTLEGRGGNLMNAAPYRLHNRRNCDQRPITHGGYRCNGEATREYEAVIGEQQLKTEYMQQLMNAVAKTFVHAAIDERFWPDICIYESILVMPKRVKSNFKLHWTNCCLQLYQRLYRVSVLITVV